MSEPQEPAPGRVCSAFVGGTWKRGVIVEIRPAKVTRARQLPARAVVDYHGGRRRRQATVPLHLVQVDLIQAC